MADARLIAVYTPSRHLGIVPLNLQTQLILINWDHVSHHIPPQWEWRSEPYNDAGTGAQQHSNFRAHRHLDLVTNTGDCQAF